MTTVCTICARGGSTGVPRKNVRMLHGKPLIAWTIEQALAVDALAGNVYVSTDDDEIARIAEDHGAMVPYRRPAELAGSDAGKLPVIEHLVEHLDATGVGVSRIVDLDPTSPLRSVDDIVNVMAMLDEDTDAVITGYPAEKNPYFNMVQEKADGTFGLVVPSTHVTRQSAPAVYSMNASIYAWHRDTLRLGLWEGRTRLYVMPHERSVDIDTELDFQLVELLMARREEA